MDNTSDIIQNLSIRLSKEGQPLGSGFLVFQSVDPEFVYVVTALHCLNGIVSGDTISIDTFNYRTKSLESSTIGPNEFQVLSFEIIDSELCLLRLPKQRLPFDIPQVTIKVCPSQGVKYRFRGFPKAYNNEEPVDIEVTPIMKSGDSFIAKTDERLEDNTSSASSNMKGLSGSGLFRLNGQQTEFCGIITHLRNLNRFEVCTFTRLNALLEKADLPTWKISSVSEEINVESGATTSAPYYALSSKLLDSAEQHIENLNPTQANNILNTALSQIKNDSINQQNRTALLARLYFLQGLAKYDMNQKNESWELLIIAHRMLPSNLDYQERAAIALLRQDKREEALNLAESIIGLNPNNPRGWVIISILQPQISIPEEVSTQPIFKILTLSFWTTKESMIPIRDLSNLLGKDSEQRVLPPSYIPRSELYYWFHLAQYSFYDFLISNVKTHSIHRNDDVSNAEQLKYSAKIYAAILERVDQTELKNHSTFRLCQFDYLICKYHITADKVYVNKAYEIFAVDDEGVLPFKQLAPLRKSVPVRAFDMLICLLQIGETTKALKVIENYSQPFEPYVYLLKAHATDQEGDQVESGKLYMEYLLQTKHVGELEFVNFCDVITRLKAQNKSKEALLELCVANKTFEKNFYHSLLSALIMLGSTVDRPKIVELCEEVYNENRQYLTTTQKVLLGGIFFELGIPSKTVDLLCQEIDFSRESPEHKIYILACWQTGTEFNILLKLLEDWRKKFSPDDQLIAIEVNLYNEMRNHSMVEQVARYGVAHFPENPLYTIRLINALNWLEKKHELKSLLVVDKLLKMDLNWRTLFQLGNIFFANDLLEGGLELYYHGLKKESDNPFVRESYFANLTSYRKIDEMPYPESAIEGSVVRLLTNKSEIVIELTSVDITHKPLAKSTLGRKIGEQFMLKDSITRRDKYYRVIQILDKYRGQLALFTDKIVKNPDDTIHIQSIPIDQNDPDSFLKRLQEEFGKSGTERKIFRKAYLKQFKDRKIGFTQLYRSVFDDNPLAAWQYITSQESDGFPIVPIIDQQNLHSDTSTEFVLDFSSIFTIFHISEGRDLTAIDKPFIVSQVLKDYFQSEIIECQIKRKSYIRAEITSEGVIPYFLSEQQIDQQIQFYKDLMTWINRNCITDFVPEILSVTRELEKTDLHYLCTVDSILLAQTSNRVLISDDLLHYTNGPFSNLTTLEHFLVKLHPQAYSEEYSFSLIRLNYRGLTLTSDHLSKCFGENQLLLNGRSDFFFALNSFSAVHNPHPENIIQVLKFIREIYAGSLGLPFKRHVSFTTLQSLLANSQITRNLIAEIENDINRLFFLMGDHLVHIKEDVGAVLEALAMGRDDSPS